MHLRYHGAVAGLYTDTADSARVQILQFQPAPAPSHIRNGISGLRADFYTVGATVYPAVLHQNMAHFAAAAQPYSVLKNKTVVRSRHHTVAKDQVLPTYNIKAVCVGYISIIPNGGVFYPHIPAHLQPTGPVGAVLEKKMVDMHPLALLQAQQPAVLTGVGKAQLGTVGAPHFNHINQVCRFSTVLRQRRAQAKAVPLSLQTAATGEGYIG